MAKSIPRVVNISCTYLQDYNKRCLSRLCFEVVHMPSTHKTPSMSWQSVGMILATVSSQNGLEVNKNGNNSEGRVITPSWSVG